VTGQWLAAAGERCPAAFRLLQRLEARGHLPRAVTEHRAYRALEEQLYAERHGWWVPRWGLAIYVPYSGTARAVLRGRFEPLSVARFRAALGPGMAVADVGANFGLYALLAARAVGARGRVHAVEPAAATVRVLEDNVARNRLGAVTVHRCAAGAVRERRALVTHWHSTLNTLYASPLAPEAGREEVDVRPLDELVPAPLDVLKIDVEGAELDVLEGARGLIAASPRLVALVEWNPSSLRAAGREPLELPERLRALGLEPRSCIDEEAGQVRALGDVLPRVASGDVSPGWYVNLWAARA